MATTSYATQGEFLEQACLAAAFQDTPGPVIDTALVWASSRLNSYIKKRVTLPLVSWSEDLKVATCYFAAKQLLDSRGVDWASGLNVTIKENFQTALDWARDIAKGLCELDTYEDSSPAVDEAGPIASSDPITDWRFQTRSSTSGDQDC